MDAHSIGRLSLKGVFVTGTDTGVGKTIVSAALMSAFPEAHYWKPVQSGSDEDDDTRTVRELAQTSDSRCWDHGYRLVIPASPHHAAEAEEVEITLEGVKAFQEKRSPDFSNFSEEE